MFARRGVGRPGIDTSVHVFPSSLVSLMSPLLVPTQIVPGATVEVEIDSITPRGRRGPPQFENPGGGGGMCVVSLGGTLRSPLKRRQWRPPAAVATGHG